MAQGGCNVKQSKVKEAWPFILTFSCSLVGEVRRWRWRSLFALAWSWLGLGLVGPTGQASKKNIIMILISVQFVLGYLPTYLLTYLLA
ncbi:hypothetical protein F4808DRAFT_442819 [Astrocystis sublimbata]|nr:hypothetical protein F4808DRAFT_442819 [Astrocystis sublimbata]